MTHNTAVVLLHQGVAYPSADWQSSLIGLPSASSADTCLAAAREVAIIAEKFLQDADFLTNPQFSFCLFVCGRMFLAHSAYNGVLFHHEFDVLVNSLWEVSRRWNGPHAASSARGTGGNLASKFASRLVEARQLGPVTVDLRQAVYSEKQTHPVSKETMSSTSAHEATPYMNRYGNVPEAQSNPLANNGSHFKSGWENASGLFNISSVEQQASPDSISLAFPPLPVSFEAPIVPQTTMHSPNFVVADRNSNQGAVQFNHAIAGFEDLESFLSHPFLPGQRVSVFSHPIGPGPPPDANQGAGQH
jgi:hypothetical protein